MRRWSMVAALLVAVSIGVSAGIPGCASSGDGTVEAADSEAEERDEREPRRRRSPRSY